MLPQILIVSIIFFIFIFLNNICIIFSHTYFALN